MESIASQKRALDSRESKTRIADRRTEAGAVNYLADFSRLS